MEPDDTDDQNQYLTIDPKEFIKDHIFMPPEQAERERKLIEEILSKSEDELTDYDKAVLNEHVKHEKELSILKTKLDLEEKLEKLNQQNELILNSAGEGIFGLDIEGRHTFVNPVAAKMLGYMPPFTSQKGQKRSLYQEPLFGKLRG